MPSSCGITLASGQREALICLAESLIQYGSGILEPDDTQFLKRAGYALRHPPFPDLPTDVVLTRDEAVALHRWTEKMRETGEYARFDECGDDCDGSCLEGAGDVLFEMLFNNGGTFSPDAGWEFPDGWRWPG